MSGPSTLDGAAGELDGHVAGEPGHQGAGGEDDPAEAEDATSAEQVRESPAEQQATERDDEALKTQLSPEG